MLNLQTTIFSKHLHWLNWENLAERSKNIGFTGIDLTVRPGGHVLPERVEEDLPKVHEICKKAGIEITMLCTNIQSSDEDAAAKILNTASQLGIKQYRMGWYFYQKERSLCENLEDIKCRLKDLAAMNEHYKIKGSYQNHDGDWFGSSVWDLGSLLKEIDSPWLGCQYDILNATIEAANSWVWGLEYLSKYIHSIDIKDALWVIENGKQKLKYVPLGQGMINLKTFLHYIHKLRINVPYSFHFEYELGGAEKGLDYLRTPAQNVISSIKNDFSLFKEMIEKNNHFEDLVIAS